MGKVNAPEEAYQLGQQAVRITLDKGMEQMRSLVREPGSAIV